MKAYLVLILSLVVVGCGEPDSKLNADPNNATNNTSNNTSNNASNNTSNNVSNNTPGLIDPSNYNQSCSFEEECMLVRSGDACGCGPCFDAAINVSDQQALQDDIAANMCAEIACPAIACGDEQLPSCDLTTNSCVVRIAKYASVDNFDRGCSEPTDCVAVYEGEICDACQSCGSSAINIADLEDYQAQFDVACSHNVDCACAAPELACNEGLCEVVQ